MRTRTYGLVGLSSPLSVLGAAIGAARAGRGSLLVVAGQAGAGKTALATAAVDAAADEDRTIWVTCWSDRGDGGRGVWAEVLEGCNARASSALGADSIDDRPELVALATEAIVEAVDHPTVIVFDDAQWADVTSLLVLAACPTGCGACHSSSSSP